MAYEVAANFILINIIMVRERKEIYVKEIEEQKLSILNKLII